MSYRVTKAERDAILTAARAIVDVATLGALPKLAFRERDELIGSWHTRLAEQYPNISQERRRQAIAKALRLERGELVRKRGENEG